MFLDSILVASDGNNSIRKFTARGIKVILNLSSDREDWSRRPHTFLALKYYNPIYKICYQKKSKLSISFFHVAFGYSNG